MTQTTQVTPPTSVRLGQRLLRFIGALVHRFIDDHGIQTAGSLTFTTLLSLVPLLTVALSLSTAFPVFQDGSKALEAYVVENFLPDEWVCELLQPFAFGVVGEDFTA